MCTLIWYLDFKFFVFFSFTLIYCLVGCLSIIVWTPAVLGVFYACVLYFCICTCSTQLSMFHMERHSKNTLIIIMIIIFIFILCRKDLMIFLLKIVCFHICLGGKGFYVHNRPMAEGKGSYICIEHLGSWHMTKVHLIIEQYRSLQILNVRQRFIYL